MNSVWVVVVIISLIVRFVVKMAKPSAPPQKMPPPPPQNYNNPFQQNTSSNQNPFQQPTPPPFPQSDNPFLPNPPSIPSNPFQQIPQNKNPSINQTDIDNLFDDNKDAFSQASTRNTNSNMGAGSQSFYCMYCGKKFQSVDALSRDTCFKHPKSDQGLQKHVLYRGAGRPNVGF